MRAKLLKIHDKKEIKKPIIWFLTLICWYFLVKCAFICSFAPDYGKNTRKRQAGRGLQKANGAQYETTQLHA